MLCTTDPSRDLLFGLLALQNGLIEQGQLVSAFHAWTRDKSRPMADHLLAHGDLDADQRAAVEALVDLHLKRHGGDPEKSLAAVAVGCSTRESLARLADADLEASLAHVGSGATAAPDDADADRTASYAVGAATSEGQRFRVLRPHAKGGLGAVFVALDTELHREVALKQILDQHDDDPSSRARFLLEAEVTGSLEHPGVVPVYGLGCDAEGRPFYAMRLVKGESLKEAIEQFHTTGAGGTGDPRWWNLELRKLLNRFVAVCNVMAYAHSRGVIHRDLKPANILLGPYGETLVVDWGLAKVVGRGEAATHAGAVEATLQPASGSGSSETLPGTALGTPAYMSPEQSEGRLEQVGPLSDLYSLGATLYCLLTGKPSIDETDVGAALRRAQRGEFPPPRAVNPCVPRALEVICLKAMALRPDERYASPRALADEIEHWLADEPVAVYREPLTTRLARWGRRHKTLAAGIGALLVTAVAALAISTVLIGSEQARTRQQFIRAEANLTVAQLQRQRADDKAREATERADDLAWQDYMNRVNRAYREVMDDNVALAEDLLLGCPPERRGLEWRYVMRLCHLERLTIDAPGQAVNAVDYSPDGNSIALGSGPLIMNQPKTNLDELHVEIREAATGRRRQTITNLKGRLYSVAFSPDGTQLVVGSGFEVPSPEARLTIWDAATGHLDWEWNWKGSEGFPGVMSVAFSPDRKTLAVGLGSYSWYSPGQVTLLNVEGRKKIKSFPAPVGGVNQLAFHPDGKRLAVAGKEIVEIWDVENRDSPRKIHTLRGHRNWIYCVAFSPDGKWLATGGWDRTIKLWNTESYDAEPSTIFGHAGFVYDLAFSPDSRSLASGGEDRKLQLWEVPTGRSLASFHGHADFVHSVAFRPDGNEIATASADGTVKLWDPKTSHPIVCLHDRGVFRMAYRHDGSRVLSGAGFLSPNYTTRGWDPITGENDPKLSKDEQLDVSNLPPDYQMGVGWGMDESASLDGRLVAQIMTNSGPISKPRTRGYVGNSVEIRDASTGAVIHTLIGHTAEVNCALFSPDGKRLATASNDYTIKLWDVANGREVFTLRGHTAGVISMVFSPDGNRLVSGGYEGEVRVWDATPLRQDLLQELESRYQQKARTLADLRDVRNHEQDLIQQAKILFKSKQWNLAAETIGRAIERNRLDYSFRYFQILSLLESGDREGIRRVVARLLVEHGSTSEPIEAFNVARYCALAPDAAADPEAPVRLAETAVSAADAWMKDCALSILGAALHRAGRFEDAIRRLEEGIQLRKRETFCSPRDWGFLAMAHHRLGHGDEARRWLDKLLSYAPGDASGFPWWYEEEICILRREAEALILGGIPAAPSALLKDATIKE